MSNLFKKTNTTTPFTNLFHREVDDLFNRFFSDWPAMTRWPESKEMANLADWSPRINLKETEKEYCVEAELPGLTEDQIEVNVENNTLMLRGEKKFEKKVDNENYHRFEHGYGTFFRAVPFPGKVDSEKVTANLKDGVLTVTAAKAPELLNTARKISVRKA